MKTATEYTQKADLLAQKLGVIVEIKFHKNGKHFEEDQNNRDIYEITIKRGQRKYTFFYGQSIMNSQYYVDLHKKGCTYTTDGATRTGNYKILDVAKYRQDGNPLKLIGGTSPTIYDIFSCLTKYDPGTFEDFCSDFGYDTDSRRAEKTYNAVKDEYTNVCALFTDAEIELLNEIE